MTWHDALMLLAAAWCLFWWCFSAYMLIVPIPGDPVFNPHEKLLGRVLIILLWAVMIATAPVWCPVKVWGGDDNDHTW